MSTFSVCSVQAIELLRRLLLPCVDFLPRMGGVSMMVHCLANEFANRGIEVLVVAPKWLGKESVLEQHYQVYRDPTSRKKLGGTSRRSAIELHQSICEQFEPDAVLLGHPQYYDLLALEFKSSNRIPIFTYFHGFDVRLLMPKVLSQRLKIAAANFIWLLLRGYTYTGRTRLLANESTKVLVNSQFTAELVKQFCGRESVVTGCGIELDRLRVEQEISKTYSPIERAKRKNELGLESSFLIGCIARLVPSKNLATLVRAVSRLPSVQLLILGSGPEKDLLRQLAADLKIEDRVQIQENVAEESKWEYLRAMDLFCLPSKTMDNGACEGFGIVLLEAAAAGCPVIAASSGGMTDVVIHEETGLLFDPLNIDDLVASISRFRDEASLAQETNKSLREVIETRFNWQAVAEILLDTFSESRSD